jgi:hypothetical protein
VGLDATPEHREVWESPLEAVVLAESSANDKTESSTFSNTTTKRVSPSNMDHGLTVDQATQLEWLFRERDCAYQHLLLNKNDNDDDDIDASQLLEILYPSDLWMTCDTTTTTTFTEWYELLLDTDFFMYLLQENVQCATSQFKQKFDGNGTFAAKMAAQKKTTTPISSTTRTKMTRTRDSTLFSSSNSNMTTTQQRHRMTLLEWGQFRRSSRNSSSHESGFLFVVLLLGIVIVYTRRIGETYCRGTTTTTAQPRQHFPTLKIKK